MPSNKRLNARDPSVIALNYFVNDLQNKHGFTRYEDFPAPKDLPKELHETWKYQCGDGYTQKLSTMYLKKRKAAISLFSTQGHLPLPEFQPTWLDTWKWQPGILKPSSTVVHFADQKPSSDPFINVPEMHMFSHVKSPQQFSSPSRKPRRSTKKNPTKDRKSCCSLNVLESDIQNAFAIRPKVVKVDGRRVAPCILFSPFYIKDRSWVRVKVDGDTATVELTTPKELLDPRKLAGCKVDKSHLLYQAYFNHLTRITAAKGAVVKFKIVLDLPFKAEAKLGSEILYPDSATGDNDGIVHAYIGDTQIQSEADWERTNPEDFLDTIVLLFVEEDNGYGVNKLVTNIKETLEIDSSDSSFEW